MNSNPAIEINGVTKYYKGFHKKILALDDIKLTVATGDIFGFLGPNGAGKTTLIKIIIGMLLPDAGTVKVMNASPFDRASKRRLGYLPERPYFHDFLTGDEFLRFHGRLFNMSDEEISRRTPEVLELVGLAKGRNLELRNYSKGMLQRIGLAQALLHNPDVLVLDEPMSGLDPVGRLEVRDLIQHIASMGKTIFFSTHIVHDVEVICSNFGFISNGKLKAVDDLDRTLGSTVKSIEVRFSLDASPLLAGASQSFDGWVKDLVLADGETIADLDRRMNEFLREIIKAGGRVISVVPRKGSLEELFFEEHKEVRR